MGDLHRQLTVPCIPGTVYSVLCDSKNLYGVQFRVKLSGRFDPQRGLSSSPCYQYEHKQLQLQYSYSYSHSVDKALPCIHMNAMSIHSTHECNFVCSRVSLDYPLLPIFPCFIQSTYMVIWIASRIRRLYARSKQVTKAHLSAELAHSLDS